MSDTNPLTAVDPKTKTELIAQLQNSLNESPVFPSFDQVTNAWVENLKKLAAEIQSAPDEEENEDEEYAGAEASFAGTKIITEGNVREDLGLWGIFKSRHNLHDQDKLEIVWNLFHNLRLDELQQLEQYIKSTRSRYNKV